MLIIKTVLRSGGVYKPDHVHAIFDMMERYVKVPFKFVCYSDLKFPLRGEIRPLKHNWPGWWAKMELFREKDEESFYIDLDMVVKGDITDMATLQSQFCALDNMTASIGGIGSALMKWQGDKTYLYDEFAKNPQFHIDNNKTYRTPYLGDQGFIFRLVEKIERFQQIFPGRIKPFNAAANADIVVYYGKNKPKLN